MPSIPAPVLPVVVVEIVSVGVVESGLVKSWTSREPAVADAKHFASIRHHAFVGTALVVTGSARPDTHRCSLLVVTSSSSTALSAAAVVNANRAMELVGRDGMNT